MTFVCCKYLTFWRPQGHFLCKLNEKKGFGQVVPNDALCVPTMWNMKCIWKLPDTEFFSIVYTLCTPLSNSFKLTTELKANQVPVFCSKCISESRNELSNCKMKLYMYVCSTAIGEKNGGKWKAASWVVFFWVFF